jgi:nicotinate-nucleotide adenylyltransferase
LTARCVAVLGGSFDPVHQGHVALAAYFSALLQPDELRIIPAGNPWQKDPLQASPADRVAMLELAFDAQNGRLSIDQQEIQRHTASYSIDTLRALRAELGPQTAIAFLIGADQLQQLHTWRDWQQLFDVAHVCAASRPGFALDAAQLDTQVAAQFKRRAGSIEQIRSTPYGRTLIGNELEVDISATEIRAVLQAGGQPETLLPPAVLDYIQQHHLYQD